MPTIFYVSYIALWLLLLVQAGLLVLVYRHFGLVALGTLEGVQRDGLPIGEPAPPMSGVTAEGADVQWTPQRKRPELLMFAAPECEPCARVLPHVSRLAMGANGHGVRATAIVTGPGENAVRLRKKFNLPFSCIAEDGGGAFDRYRVRVTPFAFVIGEDGRILAKGLCSDAARLRGLLLTAGLSEAAAMLDPMIQPTPNDTKTVVELQEVSS